MNLKQSLFLFATPAVLALTTQLLNFTDYNTTWTILGGGSISGLLAAYT